MENLTLEELCVHQVCIWKKSSFRESLECMARNGVFKTAVWKSLLDETELKSAKQNLLDSGVKAISMCPLVLLDEDAYPDPDGRLSSHRQFLEIAAELGVESVVVITGGLPSGSRDLKGQRLRVQEELSLLIPLAKAVGVRLALEPLHPMVCGHRSVISTLSEANEILDSLDANEPWGSLSTVMHYGGILRWKNKSNAQARDCIIFMFQTGCPKPGMCALTAGCLEMESSIIG